MLKVPAFKFTLTFPLLLLGACAGAPSIVSTHAVPCSSLLPPEWIKGVEGAALPGGDSVGEWVAFGDAQTGRLDVANDRYQSAVGIVSRCEARDAKAVKKARPKVLGIF